MGHIALSFKPEDKPRLTDEFMAKIALEYMQMMGITDTQFIIVRHHNTDNPHCHIVYNRINNEGKLISDRNDYRRNEQVTKALKSFFKVDCNLSDNESNAIYTSYKSLNICKCSSIFLCSSFISFSKSSNTALNIFINSVLV